VCLPVATPCRIPVFLPSILISDWAGERAETTWKSEASSGRIDPAPRVRCSWVSCHLSVKISQRYLAAKVTRNSRERLSTAGSPAPTVIIGCVR
jgi:hypothetical protein